MKVCLCSLDMENMDDISREGFRQVAAENAPWAAEIAIPDQAALIATSTQCHPLLPGIQMLELSSFVSASILQLP